MSLPITSFVFCLSVATFGGGAPVPTSPDNHRVLYTESSNGNYKTGFSTARGDYGHHDLFYAYAGANDRDGVRYGAGFLDHSAMPNAQFGVKHKIGVVGAEVDLGTNGKLGSMARVTGIDGTLHTGPVDVNYGINIDTGLKWDRGVEAKLLGVGGRLGADRIEACFIVCLGFSW